jgi:hypothetical protein
MSFPSNLIEFQERFPDEESCWRYLRQVRWPAGFECPRCGERASYFIAARRLEQCRCCRYQASLTAGTIFHRTRKPLRVWFLGVFFLARHKKGISALQFQKDAGIGSYQTAWTMLHKLRSALGPRREEKLAGLVEVDESYVGGREPGLSGGRRLVGKTLVAGAVEHRAHTAGRVRLAVLEGLTFRNDLGPFVGRSVDAEHATVRTDAFQGYGSLPKIGIAHERIVQGKDPARSAEILPWVHRVFGNLKTWLRGTFHGVSRKHMPAYLDEFSYRFDRRWREEELFGFVLRRAARGVPLPYNRLVAE